MTAPEEAPQRGTWSSGGRELVLVYFPHLWTYTIGLLGHFILARVLQPGGMGAYATCTVFVVLLSRLFLLSSEFGVQYYMISRSISVDEAVTMNVTFSTAGACMAMITGFLLVRISIFEPLFGQAPRSTLYLSLLIVFPLSLGHTLFVQLSGLRRFASLAGIQLVRITTATLAVVILVWKLDLGVNGAVLTVLIGHCVLAVLLVWDLRREYKVSLKLPHRSWFRRTVQFGLRSHPFHLGIDFERRIGIIGLGMVSTRADVGIFAVTVSFIARLGDVPGSVGVVVYPKLVSGSVHSARTVAIWLRLVGGVMAALVALLLLVNRPLVILMYSKAYLGIVPLLWIAAPGLVALALAGILVPFFNSINRPGVSSWAMGIGFGTNLVCLLILLPTLGLEGAAIALSAGFTIRTLTLAVMFHRVTGLGFGAIWLPHRGDLAYMVATLRDILPRRGAAAGT